MTSHCAFNLQYAIFFVFRLIEINETDIITVVEIFQPINKTHPPHIEQNHFEVRIAIKRTNRLNVNNNVPNLMAKSHS